MNHLTLKLLNEMRGTYDRRADVPWTTRIVECTYALWIELAQQIHTVH